MGKNHAFPSSPPEAGRTITLYFVSVFVPVEQVVHGRNDFHGSSGKGGQDRRHAKMDQSDLQRHSSAFFPRDLQICTSQGAAVFRSVWP